MPTVKRKQRRRLWSDRELARLRELYPRKSTKAVARALNRPLPSVNKQAFIMGLKKDPEYLGPMLRRMSRKLAVHGAPFRFPKGHVPENKGTRRPGWAPGRMRETQFKKGHVSARWDPEIYQVGALRVNADGYIDMKIKDGPRAWRQLHYILWEDAHGRVPKGRILRFKDGDKLNVDLANLELISRRENRLRNCIHRMYPKPLTLAILTLGQLKRRIREKQDRRPAQSPV